MATVDACGGCIYACRILVYACMRLHICQYVGFCVARSDEKGITRASECGTGNSENPTFLFEVFIFVNQSSDTRDSVGIAHRLWLETKV